MITNSAENIGLLRAELLKRRNGFVFLFSFKPTSDWQHVGAFNEHNFDRKQFNSIFSYFSKLFIADGSRITMLS